VDTLEIVIIVVVVAVALIVLGGRAVLKRRAQAGRGAFRAELAKANTDLAEAHAADNGWHPERVEAAARAAFEAQRPGTPIEALTLVQVIDPPGTDDDKAVYEVAAGGSTSRLRLGRSGDDWHLESLD
jgi:hypothetical protein